MRILVVGAGAREHALCWKLAQEPGVHVFCAPGNPGIGQTAKIFPVAAADVDGLVALVARERIDLTVIGPEAPLALGLADRLAGAGRAVLGPSHAAARLETSKAFAKDFMRRHGIPTARYVVCGDVEEARRAVADFGVPVVLKADGLAAGKGVVVATDPTTAEAAITAAMITREFGAAGTTLVVEEFLNGVEASFFALCDGQHGTDLGTAQDHKRVYDHDEGPNTGGMGAFAPAVALDEALNEVVRRTIVEPVLAGMAREGSPFRGFLYVGLMLTASGPKVIEFNVRFGDPEAQVVVPGVDEPLSPWLLRAATGQLTGEPIARTSDCFVGVVLASGGYPGHFQRGRRISGLDEAARQGDVLLFHAGTALREGELVTDGGRVLTVVGRGRDHETAMRRAYAAVTHVQFEGRHYRTDIGAKALPTRSPR